MVRALLGDDGDFEQVLVKSLGQLLARVVPFFRVCYLADSRPFQSQFRYCLMV